ncbi:DUF2600 family protein [Patulibacter defluvii]|uniref:DUF2600 family protein n=1 Tax=Patulibacter defluvii TaxID=3095358 RepID=UPI002A75B028|nr:DUF2600 family protein [Patulibacter sp. DM4]
MLAGSAGRQLRWGVGACSREHHRWLAVAERIPDPTLRGDALLALERKRHYADGAALFWTLPRRRDRRLLELLVAFQTIANFVDVASERGAAARGRSGRTLALALVDAIDVGAPPRDHYAEHPWRDDGGYLATLVAACQQRCAVLPGYPAVRERLRQEAGLLAALELEHDPDPERRDRGLRELAVAAYPGEREATWSEAAAGASSALPVMGLLALAAEPAPTPAAMAAVVEAYSWAGRLGAVLDGYVDQAEDAVSGQWSSIGYYATPDETARRLRFLIARTLRAAAALPRGRRHVVVVTAMIAMYLSHDAAHDPRLAAGTRGLVRSAGGTARLMTPILRLWRIAYGQQAA